jgi:uncharacterized protein
MQEQLIELGAGKAGKTGMLARFANRHGLITGATGTGKTISMQVLVEGLSAAGTPVFVTDVKGDFAGIARAGAPSPKTDERRKALGIRDPGFRGFPALLWDVAGRQGTPIRTTICDLGPLLLARLLNLNEVQSSILSLAFRFADAQGLALLDLKDLRALLGFLAEQGPAVAAEYGRIDRASVATIQRALTGIEAEGAAEFFGEPALDIRDLLRQDATGAGYVSVLACDRLFQQPRLYATVLTWLLSELYEELPEAGDLDRPRVALFFDEAHLLFEDAPKALLDKLEQIARLVRSKGVAVFFVTQSPLDVPESILGQLGNRVQHALRAYTPADQRVVRAAAETFRPNPKFSALDVLPVLGLGEALVSCLDGNGAPAIVERILVRPPRSRIGPLQQAERDAVIAASPVESKYRNSIDRDSAYERLAARAAAPARPSPWGPPGEPRAPVQPRGGRAPQGIGQIVMTSALRSIGSAVGREIARGILGSILRR